MLNLADCRRDLLRTISVTLQARGIAHRTRGQEFVFKTTTGEGTVHVAFIPHPGVDFDAELAASIRLSAVEDLLNPFRSHLTDGEKRSTATLGARLDTLLNYSQLIRWTVATSIDVPKAANDMVDEIESKLLPYIRRYGDLESAYALLAGPDEIARGHAPFLEGRARSVIAIATLLGRQEEAEHWITHFHTILGQIGETDMRAFDAFCTEMQRHLSAAQRGD